jgi:hypothetical protein
MIDARGIDASQRRIDASTASSIARSGESRIACASSSCSACEKRSIATQSGLADESAITRISETPATMSMPTVPYTRRFAAATYALPGPQILSTGRIDSVPYASAAIACAPPIAHALVTPARCAAASTSGLRRPSGAGTTITISRTPATCAGIAPISTDDGYAALPPGT